MSFAARSVPWLAVWTGGDVARYGRSFCRVIPLAVQDLQYNSVVVRCGIEPDKDACDFGGVHRLQHSFLGALCWYRYPMIYASGHCFAWSNPRL